VWIAAWLVLAAVPPEVAVVRADAQGCGEVRVNQRAVTGAAPGLCVVQATWTALEGGLVALLVRAPHRFEAAVRNRVFLYRLEGRRLVPRFLGSGFRDLEVVRLGEGEDRLVLEVEGADGPATLQCRLEGFPLVCER
jgi:hypothetical protein